MISPIEQDIVRTVAWFSLFRYPLSTFEIWKWMLEPSERYSYGDVQTTLSQSGHLRSVLCTEQGLYGMSRDGSSEEVPLRRERFRDATKKFKRLALVVKYLKKIPSIRGVATCNTLSWMHTRSDSDIDMFIIVKEGSIWTTRLFSVLPFRVLRMRPGQTKNSPLCFSFFLSDTSLNLEHLSLPDNDPYLAYWVQSVTPLFDRDGAFDEFMLANRWAKDYIPQSDMIKAHGLRFESSSLKTRRVPSALETISKKIQSKKFPDVIMQMANRDSRVVVTDAMLKFHVGDRREQYRDQHKSLCEAYGS